MRQSLQSAFPASNPQSEMHNPKSKIRNPQSVLGFLVIAALVLVGTSWLDGQDTRSGMRDLGCKTELGIRCSVFGVGFSQDPISNTRHPDAQFPIRNSQSVLQAVIVNRLARRPAPTGCVPSPFYDLVEQYARLHGLDGRLVAALMEAESGFDPWALSEKGAVGLMQLLPSTALDMGVSDPWDPVQNVAAGVRYLRTLLDRYGGDVQKALAAYNTGLDRVDRRESDAWPTETRQFVQRVLQAYDRLHKTCPDGMRNERLGT